MRKHLRQSACLLLCLCGLILGFSQDGKALAAEYYICAGGETAAEVAETTGVPAPLLLAANDCEAESSFLTGELLRIPAELFFSVSVQPGDTLYSLAQSYGVTVEQIQDWNQVRAERLRVGMELRIPLGEEVAAISGGQQISPALAQLSHRGEELALPVLGQVSSPFGPRWGSFHYGLDLAADQGTPVAAAAAGLVTEADWKNDAYGYAVMIDHGNGMETLYGHCSQLLVEEGQQVRVGEAIALVGSTGNSTGPHVHFEVRLQGECQDPLDYL